jgi:branched-chain amino acid transport system ATP-binding protein
MMGEPKLLLLDEPGAGVSPAQMEELVRYIQRLVAEDDVTVVLIEHDMDLVMRLCDPVIVMAQGRTLAEGAPEVVRKDARVLEAYLGSHYSVGR